MQGYVPYEDHLAVFFLESYVEVPGRIIGKPGEQERVGLGDPARRTLQALPFRVLAYGDQYIPDSVLDPWCVYPAFGRVRSPQLFGASLGQLHGKGEWLGGGSSPVSEREKRNGSSSSCGPSLR